MQFLCAPQVPPSPSLQHCCQEMLSTGVTATVLCFSFLPPLPVSWFPCKRRHSQWGTVAHTAGLGPRVFHVRHHRVSQNTPRSYSREMLWALGFDTRHCSGQPGTREADPALGTESQAENTREQSRQSEIKRHIETAVQWPYSWVGQWCGAITLASHKCTRRTHQISDKKHLKGKLFSLFFLIELESVRSFRSLLSRWLLFLSYFKMGQTWNFDSDSH